MISQMEHPIGVLRQGLAGQRPMDGAVLSSAAELAECLAELKQKSPLFAGVSFSPHVEAMFAATLAAAAN